MLVHSEQGVLTTGWYVLYRIVDEATAEWSPEGDVIRAPAPVPPLHGRTAAQQAHITRTLRHISSTARAGDCVNQAGSRYCVNKRCLFCTLKNKKREFKQELSTYKCWNNQKIWHCLRVSVQQYQSRGAWECYLYSCRETLISHYKNLQKCLADEIYFLLWEQMML